VNSHIEGLFWGIYYGPASDWPKGGAPTPNLIENTYLENRVNVTVQTARDNNAHAVKIKDVIFEDKEPGALDYNFGAFQQMHIYMWADVDRPLRNVTAYST